MFKFNGELFLPLSISLLAFAYMLSYTCTFVLASIYLIEDERIQPLDFKKSNGLRLLM